MIEVHICKTDQDWEVAKAITKDYMKWLGMDLSFQNTEKEFEGFQTMYGAPQGCFIYATVNGEVAGGVATRKLDTDICEMKRLYVHDQFKGLGIGKQLCEQILEISHSLGYRKMRLDTVDKLTAAISLYKKMGFYEIPAYYFNPDPTARFMEIEFN